MGPVRRLSVLLVLALVVAGCGGDDDGGQGDGDDDGGGAELDAAVALGLPATPAGAQLAWVLTEAAATDDDDELAARFTGAFLDAVPAADIRTVLDGLGAAVVGDVRSSTPTALDVLVTAGAATYLAQIVVEADEPHRIDTLLFGPSQSVPTPTSWPEVDARLGALATNASFLAAEVAADGSLFPIFERSPDAAGPIGSAFKLYVLGALVDAIAAGTVAWDDTVTIEAQDQSLPSGRLQDEVGETVTVAEAATLMISISDNTATDLLIRLLGRGAVEMHLPMMGMGNASRARTLPFLTTRELFALKWGGDADRLAAYAAAPEAERRTLLDQLAPTLPPVSAVAPGTPVEVERVEWFASPRELADAHLILDARRSSELDTVLTTNPGIALDPGTWSRVAFKGGSEPGVLALAWLLDRSDGRRFVVAAVAWDTDRALDEADGAAIATGAIGLLSAVP